MFKVSKRMEIAGSHYLRLPYESKCKHVHGHNWIIIVEISGNELNDDGMLIDFKHIKDLINDRFDHQNLNNTIYFGESNATAENMTIVIRDMINVLIAEKYNILEASPYAEIPFVSKVSVQESEGNIAIWEK